MLDGKRISFSIPDSILCVSLFVTVNENSKSGWNNAFKEKTTGSELREQRGWFDRSNILRKQKNFTKEIHLD